MFDMSDEDYKEILERFARMGSIRDVLEINKAKTAELEKELANER